MKIILKFIEKYLLFIPRVGTILIDDLLYTMQQQTIREKRALEQHQIIETIKTLDLTKDEVKVTLDKAVEGDYKEVIQSLVQYIQKYSK